MNKRVNDSEIEVEVLNILNKFALEKKQSDLTRYRKNILKFVLLLLCCSGFIVLGKFIYDHQHKVTAQQLQILRDKSKIVATCEQKTLQKIYAELKKDYSFKVLKKLSQEDYQHILLELENRSCF